MNPKSQFDRVLIALAMRYTDLICEVLVVAKYYRH